MSNKDNAKEFIISIVFIVLLLLLINPFEFYMPTSFVMMLLLALVIIFSVFATFIWKEKPLDEREYLHKLLAGRNAFLVGSGFLVVAIIVQAFQHNIDPWIVSALGIMILAKLAGLIQARARH